MKIVTLIEVKESFSKELQPIYSEGEIIELFAIFSGHLLGLNKIEIRNSVDKIITAEQLLTFESALKDLKTGKPFQQILGETEFYGLRFFVDENVLIPRPETEELLELAIKEIQGSRLKVKGSGLKILDIGTGSGIIPIVLKKKFPEAEITAIDFSELALKMARKNADFHLVEINFIHQDYLNENLGEIYDIIISNPPYIGIDEEVEIENSVKEFEPKMALFSPNSNALIFYEKIARDCENYLSKNGLVFLEINQKLGVETRDLFAPVLSEVALVKDLSGNDRFVWGQKSY